MFGLSSSFSQIISPFNSEKQLHFLQKYFYKLNRKKDIIEKQLWETCMRKKEIITCLESKLSNSSTETKTEAGPVNSFAILNLIIGATTFSRPGSEMQIAF